MIRVRVNLASHSIELCRYGTNLHDSPEFSLSAQDARALIRQLTAALERVEAVVGGDIDVIECCVLFTQSKGAGHEWNCPKRKEGE